MRAHRRTRRRHGRWSRSQRHVGLPFRSRTDVVWIVRRRTGAMAGASRNAGSDRWLLCASQARPPPIRSICSDAPPRAVAWPSRSRRRSGPTRSTSSTPSRCAPGSTPIAARRSGARARAGQRDGAACSSTTTRCPAASATTCGPSTPPRATCSRRRSRAACGSAVDFGVVRDARRDRGSTCASARCDAVGFRAPYTQLGQVIVGVCEPASPGCTRVAPAPLDPRTGYVNAVGTIRASALGGARRA